MSAHVRGDSPEAVAYALYRDLRGHLSGKPSEAELLALYGRCLAAVRGQSNAPDVPVGGIVSEGGRKRRNPDADGAGADAR